MDFGEEGGRALAECLMAPGEKSLVQPAARWLLRSRPFDSELVDSLCHNADELLIPPHPSRLLEADGGKMAGSVTEPDNSSTSEATREAVIHFIITRTERDHFACSRGGTLIVLSEEDGRMLSLW